MKIIFDHEKEIEVDSFFEHISANVISASKTMDVQNADDIPQLDMFGGYRDFTSIEVLAAGKPIATACRYNRIDMTSSYDDREKRFNVNMTLTWHEVENNEEDEA